MEEIQQNCDYEIADAAHDDENQLVVLPEAEWLRAQVDLITCGSDVPDLCRNCIVFEHLNRDMLPADGDQLLRELLSGKCVGGFVVACEGHDRIVLPGVCILDRSGTWAEER